MPNAATIEPRRLRGILAERQISHTEFARACGLHRSFIGGILSGNRQPGELALFKLQRGIQAFHLDSDEDTPAA